MIICGFGFLSFAAAAGSSQTEASGPARPQSIAQNEELVRDVNLYWVMPTGHDSPVIMCEFNILAYSDRLRVFLDYRMTQRTGDTSIVEPRIVLSDKIYVYPKQKIVIPILSIGEFGQGEQRHDEFHWAGPNSIEKTPPFMVDFDYQPELVFTDSNAREQKYRFRLIANERDLRAEIRIFQGENY